MSKVLNNEQGFGILESVIAILLIVIISVIGIHFYQIEHHKKIYDQSTVETIGSQASAIKSSDIHTNSSLTKHCSYTHTIFDGAPIFCFVDVSITFTQPNSVNITTQSMLTQESTLAVKTANNILNQYNNILKSFGYTFDVSFNHKTASIPEVTFNAYHQGIYYSPTRFTNAVRKDFCNISAQTTNSESGNLSVSSINLSCSVNNYDKAIYPIQN